MNNRWKQGCFVVWVSVFSCMVVAAGTASVGDMSAVTVGDNHGWRVIEQNDQMLVKSKPAQDGRVRYRIEMQVRGNLSSLVSLLKDASHRSEWDGRLKSAAVLSSQSQIRQVLHIVLDAPWPEVDREMVVQEQWYQDPDSYGVYFVQSLIPDYLQPDLQRAPVEYWQARWFLKPLGRRLVQVSAEIETDWDEHSPDWLAEYFGKHGFKDMLLAYSRESIVVYDDTKLAFVSDPYHFVPRLQRKPIPGSSAAEMVVKR